MDQSLPVRLFGVVDLSTLGLNSNSFRFGSLTLESERYVCIREELPDGTIQVCIVELHNNNNITRRAMKAESAIMNIQHNIIALKARNDGGQGHFVQVYNLDNRQKIKSHDFPEPIVYWRWLTVSILAIVTSRAVYHWKMEGSDQPILIFTRTGALSEQNTQIINYCADSKQIWCCLIGISSPDGGQTIVGNMQLYFSTQQQQQVIEGYAGCFADIPLHDDKPPVTCFCFIEKKQSEGVTKIHVMEINRPADGNKFKATTEVQYTSDRPNDFPVAIHLLGKYGLVSMITKFGYFYLFETISANLVYRTSISEDAIFVSCKSTSDDTVLGVNRRGQVIGVTINEQNLVSFISNNCRHIPDATGISFRLAQRFRLHGADQMFVQQFNRLMAAGDMAGAARVAYSAPPDLLRNSETLNKIKMLQARPDQQPMILQYFTALLNIGKLNKTETLELARPLVNSGRANLLYNWIQQDKVECSDELGDIVREADPRLALEIHQKTANPQKILVGLVETGQYDKIGSFCQQTGVQPDYLQIIRQLAVTNPDAAVNLAKQAGKSVDINAVAEIFLGLNNIKALTSYLLEVLNENLPEHAHLQTKLLEVNIRQFPQVAETIFQTDMFSQYDKVRIAQLCEQCGMFQRAMENYRDINDIRRVMLNTKQIPEEFLIGFFGHMTPNNAIQCLYDLLKNNRMDNLQIVIKTAIAYTEQLTAEALIKMFESFGSYEGLYFYLGSILHTTEDKDVYFKYIEAAAKTNNSKEVERVIRETSNYDPVRVKDFLKELRLPDPRPLIYLCDQHGYCDELARYLYKGGLNRYIQTYLVHVNNQAAPTVLGTLLDLDADENYIKQILNTLRASCPIETLVEEMEKRGKLRVIQTWLEERMAEGNQNTALHTALAKIYIDLNRNPEDFLIKNQHYDSKLVGKYCEDRDPHLAVTAYRRAWGQCDDELIDITNRNTLFRLQARYLVERKDKALWDKVLNQEDQEIRKQVIDQVVAFALPESTDSNEISIAVKAFLAAELNRELVELLEKIVLHNTEFSKNRNLQNLLIMTAIKTDKEKVAEYVNRLDNYDAPELAEYALRQYNLFEEAYLIYKKAGLNEKAIEVLLDNDSNIERAVEFAERIGSPEVWSRLAEAQLRKGLINQAIDSYLKAQDVSNYIEVIRCVEQYQQDNTFKKLIKFLQLARKKQLHQRDNIIDSELVYAFAKEDMLTDLEDFVNSSNQADIGMVGDRCYNSKLFEAARILFQSISNWAKLTSCLVKLERFTEALESARKANSPKTWKEVNFACVAHQEFRLASIAGLSIIVHPDHLDELILHYEKYGSTGELISLLESGMPLERAHMGIFTELGVLYAKYQTEKLMDHCKNYHSKLNIPKLLRACQRYGRWNESVYLFIKYDEYDNAISCMIDHSPTAWNHEIFVSTIQKATNQDLKFKAVRFYIDEQPMLLNDLLKSISSQIDHGKAVFSVRRAGHLPLILPWLQSVQMYNVVAVNEAVNELLAEQEDYEALRQSVEEFDNFDQVALAKQLEKHDLIEMRRIAGYLHRNNQRYQEALDISKNDQVYQDAMETVKMSENPDLVSDILQYFLEIQDKEAFCACTYICYEFLQPDVVLELAWKAGWIDFAIPYFIQFVKDISFRLQSMEKKEKAKAKKDEEEAEAQIHAPLEGVDPYSMGMPSFSSMQALPGIAPMQTNMMQSGMMQSGMMQTGFMDPMSMMMTNQFGGFRQ